jgi:hypothetical protein
VGAKSIVAGLCLLVCIPGCKTTRDVRGYIVEGLLNGIFDSDENLSEQVAREQNEEEWKQYWRDNPTANPKMTNAYSDQ